MTLSSRTAVAIHTLTKLAQHGQDQLLTSAEIADSLNGNPVAVRRILGQLRSAGLVESTEGYGGGWRLSRPARQISLYDAYAAVEPGPVLAGHTHPPNPGCVIGRHITTLLHSEFSAAETALQRRLSRTSIAAIHRSILDLETEAEQA
ncbi:Rrf2 family transcriptional regulator [Microlunatus parietis]|uniref:Rrf2 family protein n=1 Tax=Microlunatus parietis TaxID=682979 RepID=A0A7Y9LE35_9ACTN|nr:Rrf2 family transcriptional regulator [Microlunatus parietis]NYE73423.1 Rrf2 family protein [Microlunatus parietis]